MIFEGVEFPNWLTTAFHHPKEYYNPEKITKPKEFLDGESVTSFVYDGDVVYEDEKIKITLEVDYGGCYYESDSPSMRLTTTYKAKTPNPDYAHQLASYNQQVKLNTEIYTTVDEWSAKYKEALNKKTIRDEKAMYRKLRQKYGKEEK